jgi:acyl-CoA synthetase (NDP forming)
MSRVSEILKKARRQNQRALSEYEGKEILAAYGIPVARERLVQDLKGVHESAHEIGYPVVLKVCSPEVSHKTEKGFIEIDLRNEKDVELAFKRLQVKAREVDGLFLVQEMVKGTRELVIGMIRDPQFGPCVMFGLGGIFTEILRDVSFRVAPIEKNDALEMMRDIKAHKILEPIRGMEAVDLDVLARSLIALGRIGMEHEAIQEIDVNPLIVRGSQPVAVDALFVLNEANSEQHAVGV